MTGTSKSGKTEFILNQFDNYMAGNGFLGYGIGTSPVQLGAVVCSRSHDYYQRKVNKFPILNSNFQNFPYEMWKPSRENNLPSLQNLRDTFDRLCERTCGRGDIKLLLVENCQSLMPSKKWNDPGSITEFCAALREFLEDRNVAMLGTLGTAKMKRGESYSQLADKVFGSGQWAHEAETLMGIERHQPGYVPGQKKSTLRFLEVQAEDGSEKAIWADFNGDGHLVPIERCAEDWFASPTADLDAWLAAAPIGQKFIRDEFLEWGQRVNIGETKTKAWINLQVAKGRLDRQGLTRNTIYEKQASSLDDIGDLGEESANGSPSAPDSGTPST
jgi:hypothetical protein